MPTALPSQYPYVPSRRPRPGFWKIVLFLILIARQEALNRRMTRLTRRLAARPSERDEARLLAGARSWLRQTERISALVGVPEPPEVAELRGIFGKPPRCEKL